MAKEVMDRRASDNVYLHKDFHGALSVGIDYLHQKYGREAVVEYLHRYVASYHAPLRARIREQGLVALEEYFKSLYATEEAAVEISCTATELLLKVPRCPAVTHMREHGYPVAELWWLTTKVVNEALCEGSPFAAELVHYDEATGQSVQRFYRRTA